MNRSITCNLKNSQQIKVSPGSSVVKNLPANAGDTGSVLDLGRSHMSQSSYAHVSQLLSLSCRAWEPQLLSLHDIIIEAQVPQSLCFTRKATPMRSQHTATRKQSLLSTTGEKPTQQRRPNKTPKKQKPID